MVMFLISILHPQYKLSEKKEEEANILITEEVETEHKTDEPITTINTDKREEVHREVIALVGMKFKDHVTHRRKRISNVRFQGSRYC